MTVKLRFFLYGVEISQQECPQVPRKGDHILSNGLLLEVAMVVWASPTGAVHLYLTRDPFNNPLPHGLEEPCATPPT